MAKKGTSSLRLETMESPKSENTKPFKLSIPKYYAIKWGYIKAY